ncbi:hypothetical protein [Aurantiacibacter marinus]|uniref:HPr kinase/phosphorylase C-terminal domain-containing protein n=1 Tax=Aurantiacibacter marinus TaxID=874156 RepID=A0A0H0XRP7_9SPHN|nr:hypothetical protein [Aurantiacibacter marinus]KLI64622.1 hypothetical protein AAV99_03445 [Aurantiacibacter marinus]
MSREFSLAAECEQVSVSGAPYDRWVTPDGDIAAEFYREDSGFLVRFPGNADFHISKKLTQIVCIPAPGIAQTVIDTLFANSVTPLIGNHAGGLNLHGSAVDFGGVGAAFVGTSRRGKTTLAGACARAGHPFLSEDSIALDLSDQGFLLQPVRPVLRVFGDSAAYLTGADCDTFDGQQKAALDAGEALPFATRPVVLRAIYVLGPGDAEMPKITRLGASQALTEIMRHAFVLDVEDKARLSAHFFRLSNLVQAVPFLMLDYPRRFSVLPAVVNLLAEDLLGR